MSVAQQVLFGLLALCGTARVGVTQRSDYYILDPHTYGSPSGVYVLEVDPSKRLGSGAGVHRLTRSGEEVWNASLAFTLWDAAVADDGSVAGYAYTTGMNNNSRDGELRLVILDPQGKLRRDQALRRDERTTSSHGLPQPICDSVWLDPARDRVVFRVHHALGGRVLSDWQAARRAEAAAQQALLHPWQGRLLGDTLF